LVIDSHASIALERVSKRFAGSDHFAVFEVSLSIATGSFVAVVGSSGSGKTTLLKMINRLIEPDSGSVAIEGKPARELPAHALRREIGYVFQGIGLFPHMTVAENIAITPALLRWPKEEISKRVMELLDLVELPAAFAARAPSELSGGQRQRVGIARALAARPRLMLLDEPFGALDPITRDSIGESYRLLHKTLGLTSLMVTHDILEAVLMADRIVALRNGRVVADDTPHALLEEPPDTYVRALMDMPRRQAERVQALMSARRPASPA
jgi:osmoprotectant transport system ATP-binding protein